MGVHGDVPVGLLSLPNELHLNIISHLNCGSLHELRFVNKRYAQLIQISRLIHSPAKSPCGRNSSSNRASCCSPCCLLGLLSGGDLDPRCPNYAVHGRHRPGCCKYPSHSISREDLLIRLTSRRYTTFYRAGSHYPSMDCENQAFIVSDIEYCYTLIGIYAVREYDPSEACATPPWKTDPRFFAREQDGFTAMRRLQGVSIPVCLGAASTSHPVDGRPTAVMFVSWAGDRPTEDDIRDNQDVLSTMKRSIQECGIKDQVQNADIRFNPLSKEFVVHFSRTGGPILKTDIDSSTEKRDDEDEDEVVALDGQLSRGFFDDLFNSLEV